MSDLDQAVQAEIDAYRPVTVPAFDTLAGRKRARDRRRLATGGAVLSAVAIAGAAALAPSLGGGRDELPTVGSSPAPTAPAVTEDLDALVERCLGGVATVPVPGLVGMTEQEAFPPNVRTALRVIARDGTCTTDSAAPPVAGMTDVVLDDGRVVWAGRLTAPPEGSDDAVPVPPQAPAGAEVCKDSADGNQCYDVGAFQSERLAAALATGRLRQPDDAECPASPDAVYRVRFMPAPGLLDPWTWEIPSAACLPVAVDSARFDLDEEARGLVARVWDSAGFFAVNETTTGRNAPSPPRGGADR